MYHDVYLHSKDYRWAATLAFSANWLSFCAGFGIDFHKNVFLGHPEYDATLYISLGPFTIHLSILHLPQQQAPKPLTGEMLDRLVEKFDLYDLELGSRKVVEDE